MSKYGGKIGIKRGDDETIPGVVLPVIEEVEVQGEIRAQKLTWPEAGMRDGLQARQVLSIVTPEDNVIDFTEAAYIWWMGRQWDVISIEYKRPRVELGLGGLYNG